MFFFLQFEPIFPLPVLAIINRRVAGNGRSSSCLGPRRRGKLAQSRLRVSLLVSTDY